MKHHSLITHLYDYRRSPEKFIHIAGFHLESKRFITWFIPVMCVLDKVWTSEVCVHHNELVSSHDVWEKEEKRVSH